MPWYHYRRNVGDNKGLSCISRSVLAVNHRRIAEAAQKTTCQLLPPEHPAQTAAPCFSRRLRFKDRYHRIVQGAANPSTQAGSCAQHDPLAWALGLEVILDPCMWMRSKHQVALKSSC